MIIPYRQLTPEEMLKTCCDWLMEQQRPDGSFFKMSEADEPMNEWYMVFYPVRALLLGGRLLQNQAYTDLALAYADKYASEQLPNGAFTSTCRFQPTAGMTPAEIFDVCINQNLNVADNGSNVMGLIQAAACAGPEKRAAYLAAARRWFDGWLSVWELKRGGFNNGRWDGEIHQGAYTCAIGTASTALAAFAELTGESFYAERAVRAIEFQCRNWTAGDDGRPLNLDPYNAPGMQVALEDYGHTFYLMEGMCWAHRVCADPDSKTLIERRLTQWIFGTKGLVSQWANSWFNYMVTAFPWDAEPGDLPLSRRYSIRLGWEMAKSNGVLHCLLYYLQNIDDAPALRERVEKGMLYLTNPLKCRMSGVMSDPEESYGAFAVQSTGFAGLSLAEMIRKNSVFDLKNGDQQERP